ncbi:MAG: hypothetical protein ABFD80_13205, partial [Acidobacteriota bacterium]
MKKALILIAVAIVLVPSLAYSDILTFKMGYYSPNAVRHINGAGNTLWDYELSQINLSKDDYRGGMFGFGYEHFISPKLSFVASVDIFTKQNGGYYNDYVSNVIDDIYYAFPYSTFTGSDILQSFQVAMYPVQLSLKFYPIGRKGAFVPYFGGGGGPYFIRAEVWGSMIDFTDEYIYTDPELGDVPVYGIYGVDASETDIVLGGHVFGGFMIPIGYRLTLEA